MCAPGETEREGDTPSGWACVIADPFRKKLQHMLLQNLQCGDNLIYVIMAGLLYKRDSLQIQRTSS